MNPSKELDELLARLCEHCALATQGAEERDPATRWYFAITLVRSDEHAQTELSCGGTVPTHLMGRLFRLLAEDFDDEADPEDAPKFLC